MAADAHVTVSVTWSCVIRESAENLANIAMWESDIVRVTACKDFGLDTRSCEKCLLNLLMGREIKSFCRCTFEELLFRDFIKGDRQQLLLYYAQLFMVVFFRTIVQKTYVPRKIMNLKWWLTVEIGRRKWVELSLSNMGRGQEDEFGCTLYSKTMIDVK